MKNTILLTATAASLALLGCAHRIVQVGPDMYQVEHGGWPTMNGYKMEIRCYDDVNTFCAQRHLTLMSSQPTTINGAIFQHNASSKVVFKAVASTNAPAP